MANSKRNQDAHICPYCNREYKGGGFKNHLKTCNETIGAIRKRVDGIKTLAESQPYEAHVEEDKLYTDALLAIAAGDANGINIAREALKTLEITFKRWE